MTFGDVNVTVVLDNPSLTHCGAEAAITGKVTVAFRSRIPSITELFGPMSIAVLLDGRTKTKIRVKTSNTTTYHRGRATIVAQKLTIHSGSVRFESSKAQSFPFSIRFPETIQGDLARDRFGEDARFDTSTNSPLPPSMTCYYTGGLHKRFECFVEYRIRSEVLMPQIDVKINSFGEEEGGHIVYYEQPRVPAAIVEAAKMRTLADKFCVSNEYLLPEEERPSGWREKTKAFFKSDAYPTLAYDIAIDGNANLLLAEPIVLQLRIRPNTTLTTMLTDELPEVKVKYIWVTFKSFTQVRAEEALFGARESEDLDRGFTLFGSMLDQRPFCKANDYTKTVVTKPLGGLPTTFSTFNITRTYVVDIQMVLEAANKERKFKFREIPVRVLAPSLESNVTAMGSAMSGSAAAGPSSSSATHAASEDDEEVLPDYQPPPGYSADEKDTRVEHSRREDENEAEEEEAATAAAASRASSSMSSAGLPSSQP